jgi:class 3 adenylate cyclase/tetratricopeptide (TPR) repeat protein
MALTCAACGHANRGEARFCAGCGVSLSVSCATCGTALESDAQFCDECGAEVTAREPPGTRKVVSVVFADLAGSTGLQESLDPESVRRVMERFYKTMRTVVESHGGQVMKFIGDAVVAVFGARSLDEYDALRAVRAAAAMGVELSALNEVLASSWGVRLAMRTGVNTGELVIGEEEEIFVGDAMNTAARLEQAAAPGQVLVGEATWRLVHHAVKLESVGALELKGKAQAVPAWRLVSAEASRDGDRAPSMAPLVGRASELQRLRAALDDTLQARACRLVTVIGSPGVGKTRLASEFARALDGDARAVEGRCEPSGEGITFLPVAEILRVLAGVGEADTPESLRAKLGGLVAEDPERERLVERTAGVLGVAEAASPEETFWALRRVIESLGREHPLVLVLDDLHWGQPLLLDLVEHLVEWVRDAAVLIVALARPELRETRDALSVPGGRAVDVIELDPLDEEESRALVGELLGRAELPVALSERILETAEGNPLFLGEMLRMLVDERVLRRGRDKWVAAGDLADVEVPPTIQALLAARIERLGTDERSVVERASVIGKQFFRGAVAALVAPPVRAEIDTHLEALRRKDMVEPEGTYWIDEPVYRFHHVLIRDAAYRSLLKQARAELHERFADWLESKAGELVGEHEEVIAFHLEQAHSYRRELGPLDDRGRELGVCAATRLHSAGRRALLREDLAAATNLLGRALARDAGPDEEILWDLAETALSAGDTATAAPIVDRLANGRVAEDPRRRARAAALAGQLANLTGAGQIAATVESVVAAATELETLGDLVGEAKARHVAADSYARLGQVAAAEEALDRALAAARSADDRRRITAVLAGAPSAALWGPSPVVRASGRCLDVVRILRMTPGNRHVEAMALRCQAVLEAMRGRPQAAREILSAGRVTLEELGLALELHELSIHDGMVELLADDPFAAEGHLRGAREGFEALGVAAGAAQAAALLARALLDQTGRDEEVVHQTAAAEAQGGEDLKTTITWLSARAEALARSGEIERALSFAHRAVSVAEPTDALADKADASMALARVLLAAGRDFEAREAADAARVLYSAKGHAVGVERAMRLAGAERPPQRERIVPAPGLARRAFGDRPPERCYVELTRRWSVRDVRSMLELCDEDWVMVDHRAPGSEPIRGADGFRELLESVLQISPHIRFEIDGVLACDDRVIALRAAYRGHASDGSGDFELLGGHVAVVDGGRVLSLDQYDYDAEAAMLHRYTQLGGRQELLGDRAPERFVAEFARSYATRELERCLELYAEDWLLIDHRAIGWDETRGRDGAAAIIRSAFDGSPDMRLEVDEVLACDERVLAMRATWRGTTMEGGGELAIELGLVLAVESGRMVRMEMYEPGDRRSMIARYDELGGGRGPLGRALSRRSAAASGFSPVPAARGAERAHAEVVRRYNAHDVERLLECYDERLSFVDHRERGWEPWRGLVGAKRFYESIFASSPDVRLQIDEILACDDRVIALRTTIRTSGAEGVGELEYPFGYVATFESGRMVSHDVYDHDDRRAMVARYSELGGGLGLLGDRAPERYYAEFARRYAVRDVDHLADLYAGDWDFVDHRSIGWDDLHGRGALVDIVHSAFAVTTDLRVEVDEVLECDESVIAVRLTYLGSSRDGGGLVALPVGLVSVIESGRCVIAEQYGHDDREAMLARFAELSERRNAVGA